MFYIFDWFISSHSHILVCMYLLVSSYPYIFLSSGSYARACIPASSYPQVPVYLLVSSHPHILRFMCACFYFCILTSSYPQVHVCLLVSLHPRILRFMCACQYAHILRSMCSRYKSIIVFSHLQVHQFSAIVRVNLIS